MANIRYVRCTEIDTVLHAVEGNILNRSKLFEYLQHDSSEQFSQRGYWNYEDRSLIDLVHLREENYQLPKKGCYIMLWRRHSMFVNNIVRYGFARLRAKRNNVAPARLLHPAFSRTYNFWSCTRLLYDILLIR